MNAAVTTTPRSLNESLPHKRKRPRGFIPESHIHMRCLNESLPHKRKRRERLVMRDHNLHRASMKVFRISGRDGAA